MESRKIDLACSTRPARCVDTEYFFSFFLDCSLCGYYTVSGLHNCLQRICCPLGPLPKPRTLLAYVPGLVMAALV